MTKSSHASGFDQPQNQNNPMSDDPADGSRNAFTTGRDGGKTAADKAPKQDDQDEFDDRGLRRGRRRHRRQGIAS